jgi:predicted choloylglycine hydrolase
MYSDRVPVFEISLDIDERDRWNEVIAADKKAVQKLMAEAEEDFEDIPRVARMALRNYVAMNYKLRSGLYWNEMKAWAKALGRPMGEVIIANCAYELSHAGVGAEAVFGCTAGIRKTPNGPVHVRSMDWPLENIGPTTRLFVHREGDRKFYSIGVSGYVGVLSGMLPGGYSATINWAPPTERPTFDFGPAFLLRHVFETCDTYEEAVEALSNTRLSTAVFFTVCGTKNNEACVIERTRKEAAVRNISGPVIVQGNHHVADQFQSHNDYEDSELLEDSWERYATLEEALLDTEGDPDDLAECLDIEPVQNDWSLQQMAFCPRTGEIKVWRWL